MAKILTKAVRKNRNNNLSFEIRKVSKVFSFFSPQLVFPKCNNELTLLDVVFLARFCPFSLIIPHISSSFSLSNAFNLVLIEDHWYKRSEFHVAFHVVGDQLTMNLRTWLPTVLPVTKSS